MALKYLSKDVAVAEQVLPEQIADIAQAGIRSIVCNRPDGEGPGQADFAAIECEARRLGLEARYLPALPDQLTDAHGLAFGVLMEQLPTPILAYCRSGKRAASMWALSQAGKQSVAALLDSAAQAGHDLAALAPRLARGHARD